MRLSELDPRWLFDKDGKRAGFIFLSPTDRRWYQSCMFKPTIGPDQREMFKNALTDTEKDPEEREWLYTKVQACAQQCGWTVVNPLAVNNTQSRDPNQPPPVDLEALTFDTLSVMPSIDGSAGGLWHGFVTNGEIVGGI